MISQLEQRIDQLQGQIITIAAMLVNSYVQECFASHANKWPSREAMAHAVAGMATKDARRKLLEFMATLLEANEASKLPVMVLMRKALTRLAKADAEAVQLLDEAASAHEAEVFKP